MTPLNPIQQKFILHWGEMGTRWGINRTVAQIHALLYISPKPLNAEEIAETLAVARSNVSNSLRELQGWGIVKLVHVMGDKRDHFESMKDVWEMFRMVLDERKRREIDPTLAMLRECISEAELQKTDKHTTDRLRNLVEFFETTTAWYAQVRSWPTAALAKFVKVSDKIRKLIGLEAK
jgi:DNA-binding transcriptional regulator GbsR (MarR family)